MDKTERLFAVMDYLRRHRHPVTAEAMAGEFAVSVRTVYRDVQALVGLGAPIDGEAGIGYVLRPGFFLPPLMFRAEELEALVLGARWVEQRPDGELARAARSALAKIATASPEDLRERIGDNGLWPARGNRTAGPDEPLLQLLREAIRSEKALEIEYGDEGGRASQRLIWPVAIAYYEEKQIVAAWCTLRRDFRHFRTERIVSALPTTQRFGQRRAALFKALQAQWRERRHEREAEAAATVPDRL